MSKMIGGALQPYAKSILRIVVGITFSCHGFQKLFGFFGGLGGHGAKAHFFSMVWAAGFLETVGGLLILVGLFTSCVAFVLCGEMAVAFFTTHFPRGFWPILNGGELAVLYCFIFLYFVTAGAGPWSLDRAIRGKSRT
jgi:putative oxidoreductase